VGGPSHVTASGDFRKLPAPVWLRSSSSMRARSGVSLPQPQKGAVALASTGGLLPLLYLGCLLGRTPQRRREPADQVAC